jgi:aspartate racemase
VVGTGVAGRNRVETEGLIGFFLNSLALRTRLDGDPTFSELTRRVRETALGAYAHQDAPFERLVEALKLERDLSRNPLFQVWFILQNTPRASLTLPGLTISPVAVSHETARFDLAVGVEETPQGLDGWIEYSSELFEATTVKQMAGQLAALLERVASAPESRLSELAEMLRAMERERVEESRQSYRKTTRESLSQIKRRPAR